MAAEAESLPSHVTGIVREADPDRFLSTLYAPENRRLGLLALYAFNVEIASVRDRVKEPMAGEFRLQWWRDALQGEGAQGNPTAEALVQAITSYRLPVQPFIAALDARIFDLYDDPMPSRADLEGYCGETASALIQLAALVLDADAAPHAADAAGHAGCAQAIAGLMRLLPLHRARGQCYIPAEILSAAGLTRDEFVSDPPREAHRRALSAMIALGREHLIRFEAAAGRLAKPLRPAFLPAALARAYFDRIDAAGLAAVGESVGISPVRRHAALLRHALRGWK